MTQIERDLVQSQKDSLLNSIDKSWKSGDVDRWAEYATKLKNSIKHTCGVLDVLLNQPVEDEKPA